VLLPLRGRLGHLSWNNTGGSATDGAPARPRAAAFPRPLPGPRRRPPAPCPAPAPAPARGGDPARPLLARRGPPAARPQRGPGAASAPARVVLTLGVVRVALVWPRASPFTASAFPRVRPTLVVIIFVW
jgi:hypothetical protein